MKDKIKEIIEKNEVSHENGTYWDEQLLKDNIAKMYEDLFALTDVSQQRELLLAYEQSQMPATWMIGKGEAECRIEEFLANNCG